MVKQLQIETFHKMIEIINRAAQLVQRTDLFELRLSLSHSAWVLRYIFISIISTQIKTYRQTKRKTYIHTHTNTYSFTTLHHTAQAADMYDVTRERTREHIQQNFHTTHRIEMSIHEMNFVWRTTQFPDPTVLYISFYLLFFSLNFGSIVDLYISHHLTVFIIHHMIFIDCVFFSILDEEGKNTNAHIKIR